MRHLPLFLSVLLLGACAFINPYTITFVNEADEVIDPATSTLDVVVSAPTLAYISGVECEGADPLEILPVKSKEMTVTTVHKLPLTLMKDQPLGAKCTVTVTAYDETTTEQSSAGIEVIMYGTPMAKEGEMCGGIAGIACTEGLTCEMEDASVADASGTCTAPKEEEEDAGTTLEVESDVELDTETPNESFTEVSTETLDETGEDSSVQP